MNGLIIKKQWLDKILAGEKTWELRGSNTKVRGRIGLIASKSGLVSATCDLVDSIGPLSLKQLQTNAAKHAVSPKDFTEADDKKYFAWVLDNVKTLEKAEPYTHPQGAIIWVKL